MSDNETSKVSFDRKYRPNTLMRYVGNDKMKKTALATLAKEPRPQTGLLWGNTGCGKTTFARLLAKEYMCENRDVVSGACGTCANCMAIDEYIATGHTDMLSGIMEANLTDDNGKKDVDLILSDMEIPPYGDAWKVYILDECQGLSQQAQARFLKILEEPPENILILFCTTNPEQLLDTIKNRCQLRLHINKPTVANLAGLLKSVCQTEGADYDIKGLNFIANHSGLVIRNALKDLENILAEQDKATYECVTQVFDEVADTVIISFMEKLMVADITKRDIMGYTKIIYDIKTTTGLPNFVDSLIEFVKKGVYVINNIVLDGVSDGELLAYRRIFSNFTVEQLAVLLTKVTELTKGDMETRLIQLGYTGLAPETLVLTDSSVSSDIPKPVSELSSETKQALKSRTETESKKVDAFQKVTSEYSKPATLEDTMSLFNAQVVK